MTSALDEPAALAIASLRVLSLLMVAPIFGHQAMPTRVRVSLGLGLALALLPPLPDVHYGETPLLRLGGLALGEIAIGFGLGFGCRLIFESAGLLGEIASLQGGLGAAVAVDPTSGAASAALSSFLRTGAMLTFLAADGHHELLRAAARSFELLPIGGVSNGAGYGAFAWRPIFALGAVMFETALRLAFPIVAVMLSVNLAVGVLGRSIPQLNLITLQLPALVGLTYLMLAFGSGDYVVWIRDACTQWPGRVLGAAFGAGS